MGWNFVRIVASIKAYLLRSFSGARPPEEHEAAGLSQRATGASPRLGRQKVGAASRVIDGTG